MSITFPSDRPASIAREFAATFLVVAALDWTSLYLMHHAIHVATLWPAKGLVLAFFFLQRSRQVTHLLAAAALGGIAGKLLVGDTLLYAMVGTSISVASIAITWWCTNRLLDWNVDFREWKKLAIFIGVASCVGMATSICGAGFSSWARGGSLGANWATWSLSTVLSYTMLTPPIVLAALHDRSELPLPRKNLRIVLSVSATALVTLAAFSQTYFPITYLVPIALLITSLVAEIEGAAWALLATAIVSLACTVLGLAPLKLVFPSVNYHVFVVQVFLAALSVGILPAAAAITERRKLRDRLVASLSETRRAAAALQESERRYRLLADNATDIIVQIDRNGETIYVSPACRAFGYEPDELARMGGNALVHPDDIANHQANVADLLAGHLGDPGRTREHRFRARNGDWVWLQGNPSILRDESGAPCGFVNVFRDVTERKAMETELITARERAEAAALAKSEFLANMSHELRTPLTSVIGFADLLNDTCELAEQPKRYVTRVCSASRALLSTINDILDYSRLESGQIEFAPEPVRIDSHAQDIVELFAARAQAKGIELELKCAPDLSAASFMVDPQRLRQVLLNLLGNAVKFTDAGKVTLRIDRSIAQTASASQQLRFEIEDTGPGIPSDRMDRLFQRFSQVDRSTTRSHGGSGLGLAICKGLVEGMGGQIGVSTEYGTGSLFWFEIPTNSVTAAATVADSPRATADMRAKILVVDDNDANRLLVRAALGTIWADIVEAASGPDAIAAASRERFDLILMDIHMPGMSGTSAMHAIRQQKTSSACAPIVAFTAENDAAHLAALRDHGFDGTLTKPIVIAELLTCVVRALAANPAETAEIPRHVA